jgi:hypothetical protein
MLAWVPKRKVLQGIVRVAVLRRTACLERLVWVLQIDEYRPPSWHHVSVQCTGSSRANWISELTTSVVAAWSTTAAHRDGIAQLFVGDDVMRAAGDTICDVHPADIRTARPRVEGFGLLGGQLEQLLHVEELDAVARALGADDQSVSNFLDLPPDHAL